MTVLTMLVHTVIISVTTVIIGDLIVHSAPQVDTTSLQVYKEYCEAETFTATCPTSQVVVMRQALYGRMRLGRCVIRDYGYVGCFADVLPHLDAMCSGSRKCTVRIPDTSLDLVNPCPKDFKTYLEVSYDCVAAHFVECGLCDNNTHSTYIPSGSTKSGFISGELNKETCRGKPCPVIVRVAPGQKINITLWDFTLEDDERNLLRQQILGVETCYRYAVLLEKSGAGREVDVCGGWRRVRHVYTSMTNQLEIQMIGTLVKERVPKFLLRYEAFGCPDFEAPPTMWMRRSEDWILVGCHKGGSSYRVVCRDNEWSGNIGDCSDGPSAVITDINIDVANQPAGVFITIVTGIAFIIGATVLILGLVLIRRCCTRLEGRNQSLRYGTTSRCIPDGDAHCPEDFIKDCGQPMLDTYYTTSNKLWQCSDQSPTNQSSCYIDRPTNQSSCYTDRTPSGGTATYSTTRAITCETPCYYETRQPINGQDSRQQPIKLQHSRHQPITVQDSVELQTLPSNKQTTCNCPQPLYDVTNTLKSLYDVTTSCHDVTTSCHDVTASCHMCDVTSPYSCATHHCGIPSHYVRRSHNIDKPSDLDLNKRNIAISTANDTST